MKRFVVSFYHDAAAYFLKPDLTDLTPENLIENVKRDCIKNSAVYVKNGLQNCSFWILGTFDDTTGFFDQSEKAELISQKEVLTLVSEALGEVEYGNGKKF